MSASLKKLPNWDGNQCFGCGEKNIHGLQMAFSADNATVTSDIIVPPHLCGWQKIVHGGVSATILDEVMSWAAIYLLKRFILTKSITVDYRKPLFVGESIKAEGRILERINDRRAIMKGVLLNADGQACVRAEGTFALFTAEKARALGILDDDNARRHFDALIGGHSE